MIVEGDLLTLRFFVWKCHSETFLPHCLSVFLTTHLQFSVFSLGKNQIIPTQVEFIHAPYNFLRMYIPTQLHDAWSSNIQNPCDIVKRYETRAWSSARNTRAAKGARRLRTRQNKRRYQFRNTHAHRHASYGNRIGFLCILFRTKITQELKIWRRQRIQRAQRKFRRVLNKFDDVTLLLFLIFLFSSWVRATERSCSPALFSANRSNCAMWIEDA